MRDYHAIVLYKNFSYHCDHVKFSAKNDQDACKQICDVILNRQLLKKTKNLEMSEIDTIRIYRKFISLFQLKNSDLITVISGEIMNKHIKNATSQIQTCKIS